ncbi:MAG: hypothetical protein HQK52_22225 [Oligoflexia bacterium]|nr:hypothetical protein [Oligoflexia bacterium]
MGSAVGRRIKTIKEVGITYTHPHTLQKVGSKGTIISEPSSSHNTDAKIYIAHFDDSYVTDNNAEITDDQFEFIDD